MSICVLHTNKTNNFTYIIEQFRRQNYANKTLVILDSMNKSMPCDIPSNLSIKYMNPLIVLNTKFEENNSNLISHSDKVKSIVKDIDLELKKKNDIEKEIKAVQTKKSSDDESEEKAKKVSELKNKLQRVLDEMKQLDLKKRKEEEQLSKIKSNNGSLIKQISQIRERGMRFSDFKEIILADTPADVYTFMEDGFVFHASHLDTVVKRLSVSSLGVVTYTDAFVYGSSKLSLRVASRGNSLIVPLSSFNKKYLLENDIDAPITSYDSMNSKAVCITSHDKDVLSVFKKIMIVYSHNKSSILNMFNLR